MVVWTSDSTQKEVVTIVDYSDKINHWVSECPIGWHLSSVVECEDWINSAIDAHIQTYGERRVYEENCWILCTGPRPGVGSELRQTEKMRGGGAQSADCWSKTFTPTTSYTF